MARYASDLEFRMQILGVVVMAPILNLLNDAYGIGDKLPAPH